MYLVRPVPAGTEDLAGLEAERLEWAARRALHREQLRTDYLALKDRLKIMPVPIRAGSRIGDCLHEALITLFPDRLRQALGHREPTAAALREDFAWRLEEDFTRADRGQPTLYAHFFPGTITSPSVTDAQRQAARDKALDEIRNGWDNDSGDNTAAAYALAYELRLVLLGQYQAINIGPPPGPREGYVLYEFDHYTAATSGTAVRPAEQLYKHPARHPPGCRKPARCPPVNRTWPRCCATSKPTRPALRCCGPASPP